MKKKGQLPKRPGNIWCFLSWHDPVLQVIVERATLTEEIVFMRETCKVCKGHLGDSEPIRRIISPCHSSMEGRALNKIIGRHGSAYLEFMRKHLGRSGPNGLG